MQEQEIVESTIYKKIINGNLQGSVDRGKIQLARTGSKPILPMNFLFFKRKKRENSVLSFTSSSSNFFFSSLSLSSFSWGTNICAPEQAY